MKQVTKKEFWEFINNLKVNVHSRPEGSYPYTSIFHTVGFYGKSEEIKAKIIPVKDSDWPVDNEYFINEEISSR